MNGLDKRSIVTAIFSHGATIYSNPSLESSEETITDPICLTIGAQSGTLQIGGKELDLRLLHTAKWEEGRLWLGFFVTPLWIALSGDDCSKAGMELIIKQITALHAQHRRHQGELAEFEVIEEAREEPKLVNGPWRLCQANKGYDLCPTYPKAFYVPSSITDSVIKHAARHRVKQRLPILAYQHDNLDGPVLIRSGQPLVGLSRKRSIQDEYLLDSFRTLNSSIPARPLLIIDARPTVNALANTIAGAGFEPLEWYAGAERAFVNLENVHRVKGAFLRLAVDPAEWLEHSRRLLVATKTIIEALSGAEPKSVLVHCSDGWDRTSQLISLAKSCLNQRYRTRTGLRELIREDWLDAGHKFTDRLAQGRPLVNTISFSRPGQDTDAISTWFASLGTRNPPTSSLFKEWCPIFPQFLDCLGHIVMEHPDAFEYGIEDLRGLIKEAFRSNSSWLSGNCQAERKVFPVSSFPGSLAKSKVILPPIMLENISTIF